MQSSMECPIPVKPSSSGEKKPKKFGSDVASMMSEYFRSIIKSLRADSLFGFDRTRNLLPRRLACLQHRDALIHVTVKTRDDVCGNDLADARGRCCACVNGAFDRRDIAAHNRRHQS